MKVDAKCENCGNMSTLNIPDDKAGSGKNIDVQWRCKGCGRQNLYKLRNSTVGPAPGGNDNPNKSEHGKCYNFMAKHPCLKYVL
jgi:DNA-directed RNA polymerase subunit RPC12/RpoP